VLIPAAGWRAGSWACRSLSKAGFEVIAGEEEGRIANRTRYCSELIRHPSPSADPLAFVSAIEEICTSHRVSVVLPIDDEVVHLLAANSPSPGDAVVVGPTIAQYRRLCDKNSLAEVGKEAGFASLERVVVGADGPSGDWPALPSMVKPRSSGVATATGLFTRKPVLVRSEAERDAAVEDLIGAAGEALVEEQIRGSAWRVHFVRDPQTTVTLTLQSLRAYPLQTGQSSVLRVAPAPSKLVEISLQLLELVDYHGPGSIQVIERDGDFFVHDVNLRLPVTVGATISAGLDMPRLAVEGALGGLSGPVPASFRPVTYVSLHGEARHLLDGLRRRPTSAPVHRIAADLVLASFMRNRVLDPLNLADPLPIALGGLELMRRVRRRDPGSKMGGSLRQAPALDVEPPDKR